MTKEELKRRLRKVQQYKSGSDSGTQFSDACQIAEDALFELKEAYTKDEVILIFEKYCRYRNDYETSGDEPMEFAQWLGGQDSILISKPEIQLSK
jgi:hypothetical protein